MTVTSIREQGKTDLGFHASLVFEGKEYPVVITDPFTTQEEKQLEWYFKDWSVSPFRDIVRAQQVASSIRIYGERLFQQLFQDRQAYSEYQKQRAASLSQLRFEIVATTPEFHALHWEALRDPDLPRPLAVDCVIVRKNSQPPPSVSASTRPSPVINVLVVVARPDEENDLGYRTISRPLIEAIKNSQLRVNVELLSPGTYQALSQHLEQKGAGYYHIVHFDTHTSLMTYEQMQQGVKADRYIYQERRGRYHFQPYDGVKAFVFLEGESKGKADPVEAKELADLLIDKRIPVCFFHACQSDEQVYSPQYSHQVTSDRSGQTTLGSQLMAEGVQMVVTMGYSMTVSATKLMIEKVYTHLFDEKGITEAIRLGRRELFMNKSRKAYFNKFIDLEDWLFPVVYNNYPVNFNLRQFTQEEEQYWKFQRNRYLFKQPEYGFMGRDLDILKIEKALKQHNILLLQGIGGAGKTTLLDYLREWWQTTHFALNVFYFSYDEKAWTIKQILFEISKQVYKGFQPAQFQAMSETAVVQKLVTKLRSETYTLILDNLESLAIQNTLPETERTKIKDFLECLVGGKSRVILGSRSGEEWLQPITFKNNIYQLHGLDEEASTELAERILVQHVATNRIEDICQDVDFQKLMNLLAGYPLAMEVILPNLKQQSIQKILQGLQAADVQDIDSEDKTNSILEVVEAYHKNLSLKSRNLLLFLAPFSGFVHSSVLPKYINKLRKIQQFNEYKFDGFEAAIQEAIQLNLLVKNEDNNKHLIEVKPGFSYLLKSKLTTIDKTIYGALQEGFKNHYQALANDYKALMNSKDDQKQQWGKFFCEHEYENLYNALKICLKNHESISIYFCLYKYFELINDSESNLKLSESVCEVVEKYPPEFLQSELGYEVAWALARLGSCQLSAKHYLQARESYKKALVIIGNVDDKQKQLWRSVSYHNLGTIAEQLGEYEEARSNYQQALQIKIKYGDPYSQAITYYHLGSVAREVGEYEEARHNYHQALQIYLEHADYHLLASTYHELGIVAQQQRKYEEARRNYHQALHLYIEHGNSYSQAAAYQELGIIAQELQEYEEARHNYHQALQIFMEHGDSYSQAVTYAHLGSLAEKMREYGLAQRNYQQALEIFIQRNDRYSQGVTYAHFGSLSEQVGEYDEARSSYQQALQIFIEYDDRYSQAITYSHLGNLAEKMEEYHEARNNYHRALQIYTEHSGSGSGSEERASERASAQQRSPLASPKERSAVLYSIASTYHDLGIVAQELREYDEAWHNYQQALQIFMEHDDSYSQGITYHQLGSLAEQVGEYGEAKRNYQQALQIYNEHGDRYSLASTYHELGIVAEQVGEYDEARRYYEQALQIFVEYRDHYSQARTYFQLGSLTQLQQDYTEARVNFQKALEIYVEHNDEDWAAITRENLRRLN